MKWELHREEEKDMGGRQASGLLPARLVPML